MSASSERVWGEQPAQVGAELEEAGDDEIGQRPGEDGIGQGADAAHAGGPQGVERPRLGRLVDQLGVDLGRDGPERNGDGQDPDHGVAAEDVHQEQAPHRLVDPPGQARQSPAGEPAEPQGGATAAPGGPRPPPPRLAGENAADHADRHRKGGAEDGEGDRGQRRLPRDPKEVP